MKMAVGSVLALTVVNLQAALILTNGDFETIIGDTGNITIDPGGWTDSVGTGMVGPFSDSSATADLPGWTGAAGVSVVANQGPIAGVHSIAINSYSWGNPAGQFAASTVVSDSIGASDGTPLTISLWADGGTAFPVVFDLLVNGSPLLPTTSEDPALGSGKVKFKRSYDAATMGSISGLDLTIQFGLAPTNGFGGGQVKFDDVTVPEPATMSLLALGGLALLRRKRH